MRPSAVPPPSGRAGGSERTRPASRRLAGRTGLRGAPRPRRTHLVLQSMVTCRCGAVCRSVRPPPPIRGERGCSQWRRRRAHVAAPPARPRLPPHPTPPPGLSVTAAAAWPPSPRPGPLSVPATPAARSDSGTFCKPGSRRKGGGRGARGRAGRCTWASRPAEDGRPAGSPRPGQPLRGSPQSAEACHPANSKVSRCPQRCTNQLPSWVQARLQGIQPPTSPTVEYLEKYLHLQAVFYITCTRNRVPCMSHCKFGAHVNAPWVRPHSSCGLVPAP